MKRIPSIRAVMTPFPYSIEFDRSVRDARRMMADKDIRHLPVVDKQSRLVGVLTARDIRLATAAGRQPVPEEELRVGDVCGMQAYTVESTERLDRVLKQMADRHIGATLVLKDGRLAGIFTHADACRKFAELLDTLFPGGGGDDAA